MSDVIGICLEYLTLLFGHDKVLFIYVFGSTSSMSQKASQNSTVQSKEHTEAAY